MTLRLLVMLVVGLGLVPPNADAANPELIRKALIKLLGTGSKSAPKQVDEFPSLKSPLKSIDEDRILDGPLITRSIAKARHKRECPTSHLRVSLPLLNVGITVPKNLNIRTGPGTGNQIQARISNAGKYIVDLVNTNECWIRIRYKSQNGKQKGWVSAKHLDFEYDNHLTKPQNRLTRNLSASGVYELVAGSTYKIKTQSSQGTAVAISPTVLLTNCHVMGEYVTAHIIEGGNGHISYLIHSEHSKDKCFIRSLFLKVRPISNVKRFNQIRQGDRAYTIGAPLGNNRTLGEGSIFGVQGHYGDRLIESTAPVEPGSSGGGLFDDKGNLLGITTYKTTTYSGQSYSKSIAAEDFWK
ncbi:MAG: trypsin-like peptidase domain-containing protein [Spirochaetia bacterium]|nr:trypsin-like peptidase domain-containing protein [Spirochaetia bacterium]